MANHPIPTQPLSDGDKLMLEKFAAEIPAQSERLDALARQMIVVELAIPGLFATVLKLVNGKEATITLSPTLYFTFGCWLLALLLSLASLFPKKYLVDQTRLKDDGKRESGLPYSIEGYFQASASYKWRLLFVACLLFIAGVISAMFAVL